MKNISVFDHCFGCGVCYAACPTHAVAMRFNDNGFYAPVVDSSKCVGCGLCVKVCAFNHTKPMQEETAFHCYAAWSKDADIRYKCTSGGVGFEIGRYLISKGYKVIACRYNAQKQVAEHYLAENEIQLAESIGSKYLQSDTTQGFCEIRKGGKYLVVGAPCQIDSIKRWMFQRGMSDDVVLLDFFCHGVPSMLMWQQYLKEVEAQIGEVGNVSWRSKETGWHDSWVMKAASGEKQSVLHFSKGDLFYKMFLGDRCLNKTCYEDCKYKYDKSAADIRIGDLWGTKYADDEQGVSGVVCFTEKGQKLLEQLPDRLHIEASTLEIVGESQMKRCARRPISYNYVMKLLKSETPLAEINKKAFRIEIIDRVSQKLRYYIKRIPYKLHLLK